MEVAVLEKFVKQYGPLFDGFRNLMTSADRPLLAHYTTFQTLEAVLSKEEFWFSCPLFMNDHEEMSFGMNLGRYVFNKLVGDQNFVEACGGKARADVYRNQMNNLFDAVDQSALDFFVLCFAEHDADNDDGLLSMWRGYGGNGAGAALIIDPTCLPFNEASPLIVAKVNYMATNEREEWVVKTVRDAMEFAKDPSFDDEILKQHAEKLFEVLLLAALLTKHRGFEEEREWRVIYLPYRNPGSPVKEHIGYTLVSEKVEPKLKLPIRPIEEGPETWKFDDLVKKIILGPTHNSAIAMNSACKMLTALKKDAWVSKLVASSIPYRNKR